MYQKGWKEKGESDGANAPLSSSLSSSPFLHFLPLTYLATQRLANSALALILAWPTTFPVSTFSRAARERRQWGRSRLLQFLSLLLSPNQQHSAIPFQLLPEFSAPLPSVQLSPPSREEASSLPQLSSLFLALSCQLLSYQPRSPLPKTATGSKHSYSEYDNHSSPYN